MPVVEPATTPKLYAKPIVLRPTKKQQFLLEFLQNFISEHGYGPSYREIMGGCNYTSVATVAAHVQNLISRGQLRKNGRSARSLEIVGEVTSRPRLQTNDIKPAEEKWLVEKIEYQFKQIEESVDIKESDLSNLKTLVDALKVLNLSGASSNFSLRLNDIKKRLQEL